MSSRLTRQEIKRDEVLETFGSVVHYVRGHLRLILVGFAVLALLALAAVAVAAHRSRRAEQASGALADALRIHQAPVDPADADPDHPRSPSFADDASRRERARQALVSVRESFPGTPAAGLAGVYLGELDALDGDLESARERWEEFVERRPAHALGFVVRINLMELDRSEGRAAALAEELRASLEDPREAMPKPMLLDQLGLTLDELGRPGEALEVYQRLVEEHEGSAYQGHAQRRIEAIEAELDRG